MALNDFAHAAPISVSFQDDLRTRTHRSDKFAADG